MERKCPVGLRPLPTARSTQSLFHPLPPTPPSSLPPYPLLQRQSEGTARARATGTPGTSPKLLGAGAGAGIQSYKIRVGYPDSGEPQVGWLQAMCSLKPKGSGQDHLWGWRRVSVCLCGSFPSCCFLSPALCAPAWRTVTKATACSVAKSTHLFSSQSPYRRGDI